MSKFAVVGAMCSGKTTTINGFKETEGLGIVPDAGRQYLEANPSADRQSRAANLAIVNRAKELEKSRGSADTLLCDGCVLTPIAHLVAYERKSLVDELLNLNREYLASYTLRFLMDTHGVPYKNDSTRIEDTDFRDRLQCAFVDLLDYCDLRYVFVTGTVAERRKEVRGIVLDNKLHES